MLNLEVTYTLFYSTTTLMRRNTLFIIALALIVIAFTGWSLRGHFFMWKMKQSGFPPSQLVAMKGKAMPLLCRAAEKLDESSNPEWSKAIAFALQETRYKVTSRKTGSTKYTHNATVLEPVDEKMAQALKKAYKNCPDTETRIEIITAMADLDYRQKARFFCDVFESSHPVEKEFLIMRAEELVRLAFDEHEPNGNYFGWENLDQKGLKQKQQQMQDLLQQCVLPLAQQEWSRAHAAAGGEAPDWANLWEDALTQLNVRLEGAPLLSNAFTFCQGDKAPLPLTIDMEWLQKNLTINACRMNEAEWRNAGLNEAEAFQNNFEYFRLGEIQPQTAIFVRYYPEESKAWLCEWDKEKKLTRSEEIYYSNAEGMMSKTPVIKPDGKIEVAWYNDYMGDSTYVLKYDN